MFPKRVEYVSRETLASEVGVVIDFEKSDFQNIDGIVDKINKEIKEDNKTWALCGRRQNENNYVVLQVASSNEMIKEIKRDLNRMMPFITDDSDTWNSYFYKDIFDVRYRQDHVSQKYQNMYNLFDVFCVVIADCSKCLKDVDFEKGKEAQYMEVKIACDYRAVYWWPNNSNGESEILHKHREWIRVIPREWWDVNKGEVVLTNYAPKWLIADYRDYKRTIDRMEKDNYIVDDRPRPVDPVISRIDSCDLDELEILLYGKATEK